MTAEQQVPFGQIIARGVTFLGAGNLVLRFFDVAVAILLLQWLSIYEFGVYRLSLAAFDFGTGFFLSGLENVVVSDVSGAVAKEPRRAKALFSTYIYFMSAIALILWGAFYFGFFLFKAWIPEGADYLRIVSFLFILAPLETIYKWQFQVFLNFGWATLLRVMRDITRLVAILVAFFIFSFGLREALWTLVIAGYLPILIAILGYRGQYLLLIPTLSEMGQALRELFLRHGKWAIADDFLANTGKNIRPFIIRFFAGTEAVAVFAVAQNLYTYTTAMFPIREVLTPVMPRITEDPVHLSSQVAKAAKYSAFVYSLIAIAGVVVAPLFIYLLFPKYMPSLLPYYILLIGLPALGYRSVLITVFYALRQQRALFTLTAFRISMVTVLGVILVYLFGIYGAALEIALVNIILTPAFSRALKKTLPEWRGSLWDVFTFDAYDKIAVATIWSHIRKKVFRFS